MYIYNNGNPVMTEGFEPGCNAVYKDKAGTHFGKIEKSVRGDPNDEKYKTDCVTILISRYDCVAEFPMYDGTNWFVGINEVTT